MRLNRASLAIGSWMNLAAAQSTLSTSNFAASLAAGSGVLRSLQPSADTTFDFSPADFFANRTHDGQYHTGDLTFRYRAVNGSDSWIGADTAAIRNNNTLATVGADGSVSSSLNAAFGNLTRDLNVTRRWFDHEGDLGLEFTLENLGSDTLEIGSLDMPIEFNNIFSTRTAVETTNKCVLLDPYIGLHAGYVQVTRLTGTGPHLVITPLNTDSKFEAWKFLSEPSIEPLGYQLQTYEGNYAWQTHSKAYAENEWSDAEPWNTPTSATLPTGKALTVGLRFSVASSVYKIEETVSSVGLPVAVGAPGYVIPTDVTGHLFLNSNQSVQSVNVEPAGSLVFTPSNANSTWQRYDVQSSSDAFGRAKATITYADGTLQTVHYWIAHAGTSAISEAGQFLTNEQWYTDTSDPFGRAPSVITYNRTANDFVLQDTRAWIAGLSDEGGAGSFLAAGMKQSVQPAADEVLKLEEFVQEVVWGRLQISSGNETYAVRKSLFYYEPELLPDYVYSSEFNWTESVWDKEAAYLINRAYDYVHVSALYWGLYRAGRTHQGMLSKQSADWYLLQAFNTIAFAFGSANGTANTDYTNVGLMGETVWLYIIEDLRADNHTAEASNLEAIMHSRQQLWATQADPFGSEMAWDSTGQEGVYLWADYFNDNTTAQKTIRSIRGFMPTIPHWGYNGNARRYWDFLYGGSYRLARIERQIHHYGSGLNSLPLLANYREAEDPNSLEALYDLRVGYGGNQGPLSNIDEDGFGSMAFHSYPDTLHWDEYSGDYGPNFLGHVLGAATYLVKHPDFGYISFGGNVRSLNTTCNLVTVEPRDSVQKRIFVAPVSLWVEIDAGLIESFTFDPEYNTVEVSIEKDSSSASCGRNGSQSVKMKWEQTGQQSTVGMVELQSTLEQNSGAYTVDLPATISFTI